MSVIWHQQTHGVPIRQSKSERTVALVFLAVITVSTLLGATYLGLVADNVRLSRQVWAMEQALVLTERRSQVMTVEIARLSSIPVLQERSIQLDFHPASNVEYLYLREP